MYAVIQTGGKQYRVQPGDIIQVEKLEGEVGSSVKFDEVLFASNGQAEGSKIWMGAPLLSGAAVSAEIVGQGRGDKILIVKMKRRKQYRRTLGHRQEQTQLLVTSLSNGAGETANLSAEEKKARLTKFQSHLTAKGPAMTPKTLGSRKRMAAARAAAGKPGATGAGTEAKAKAPAAKKKTATKKKASE